jgi:DNA-binding LacI/PurR family transcriptional regulator
VFNEIGFDAKKEGVLFASFDDISLFDFVKPNIISVSQPLEQIGIEAANLALKLIDTKGVDESGYKKVVLPTSIISRN